MFYLEPDHHQPKHSGDPISSVPPHLRNFSWPAYEAQVLAGLLPDLKSAVSKLTKKLSTKRVHSTRVNLRRWQAVGQIVANNDWKAIEYQRLDKSLNKLRKSLGQLRDSEILLELASDLKLPKRLRRRFKAERKELLKEVDKYLAKAEPMPHLKSFARLIRKRKKQLAIQEDLSQFGYVSAFHHLEPLLERMEEQTRDLEPNAIAPEQLHQLRIMIKNWRYFLTEFYGLTNLQLVKAQQVLGKLHDLDRLLEVLKESGRLSMLDNQKLEQIKTRRKELLDEFDSFRESLPYGLRPSITSYVEATAAAT
jgi:CHAD domain-containing protein